MSGVISRLLMFLMFALWTIFFAIIDIFSLHFTGLYNGHLHEAGLDRQQDDV